MLYVGCTWAVPQGPTTWKTPKVNSQFEGEETEVTEIK